MSRRVETPEERAARLRELAERGGTIELDEYRRRSRRSFLGFGATAVAGVLGFRYLQNRPEDNNIPDALRATLEWNEKVWDNIGRDNALSPTFDLDDREPLRVNGTRGMRGSDNRYTDIDLDAWSLTVVGVDGNELETLDTGPIMALPRHDIVWEHKCIEGWSAIVHWTGARFSDFAARYADDVPPDYKYVSLRTPDDGYYVGLERSDVLHPQTLLAWGLNGEPLTQRHGAPLRLATPIKYGIKQIKRIGLIEFTNERPTDFWYERGYDWDAGF